MPKRSGLLPCFARNAEGCFGSSTLGRRWEQGTGPTEGGTGDRSFVVTSPVGKKRSFDKLMDLAQWAAANALGKPESEWLMNGRDVE